MLQPLLFHEIEPMRRFVRDAQSQGKSVGLVPTMGALHEGHLSLVRAAHKQVDLCVVTIFVNPTQFAPHEDLSRYPRPKECDLKLLAGEQVVAVFHPTPDVMYPSGFGTYVDPADVALPLEGEFRPTHFRGVATVVMKLFQIIPADIAYFGQKDYQQLRVIQQMALDLNVPTRIVGCPIVRDEDGLAMSSRNAYLTPSQRKIGLSLSRALGCAQQLIEEGETDVEQIEAAMKEQLVEVDRLDYAVIVDANDLSPLRKMDRTAIALIAAHVGQTRLIDNRILHIPAL